MGVALLSVAGLLISAYLWMFKHGYIGILPARARSTMQSAVLPPPVPMAVKVPRGRGWMIGALIGVPLAAAAFTAVVILAARTETASPAPRASAPPPPPPPAKRAIQPPPPPAPPAPPAPPPKAKPAPVAAPTPDQITLSVTTEPTGATVVLDGVRLGTSPLQMIVPARTKPAWLKVRRRGSVATKIQVSLERDVTWDVRLRALHP